MQEITPQRINELVSKHNGCVHALWEIWNFNDGVHPEHLKVKQEPFAKLFDELYRVRYNPETDYADAEIAFAYTAQRVFNEYERFDRDIRREITRLRRNFIRDYIVALINLTNQVNEFMKYDNLNKFQPDELRKLSKFCFYCTQNIDVNHQYIGKTLSDAEIDKWAQEVKDNKDVRFDIQVLAEHIKWFNRMKKNILARNSKNLDVPIIQNQPMGR